MLSALDALRGRLTPHLADGQITRPIWVLAAPYCSGSAAVAQMLLDEGAALRPMPENLTRLYRMAPRLFEANSSVQSHLGADIYLQRHTARVRETLRPLMREIARYDLFLHGPLGQTTLHPYVIKAIAPQARLIWVRRGYKSWLKAVEAHECAHPERYPEHVGWHEDRDGRRALLFQRRRVERRKFLRLAKEFPENCLDLKRDDPNLATRLADFIHYDG